MRELQTTYEDYERVMVALARDAEWSFVDEGEQVAIEAVFADATYGPALLHIGALELESRDVPAALGVEYVPSDDALTGRVAQIVPLDEAAALQAAMWRLLLTQQMVTMLPKENGAYDLSLLRYAFQPHNVPATPEVG